MDYEKHENGMDEQKPNETDTDEGKTSYLALGMCFGVGIGSAIGGLLFDNMTMGISIGIGLGVMVGAIMDARRVPK
jgi:hypothetical protein